MGKKKYVLCYGDSNTWGVTPDRNGFYNFLRRVPEDERWTGIAQNLLGDEYKLLVDGNCGRTTVWEDPIEGDKNGNLYLKPCLWAQMPLDLVVIMLGTNDLKPRFAVNAWDVALGVEVLINTVLKSGCGEGGTTPPILIMSPILVGENIGETWLDGMFGGWERGKLSLDFARHFKTVADKYHCHFLDAAQYARPSDEDCIHIRLEDHRPLGEAVAAKIREILG